MRGKITWFLGIVGVSSLLVLSGTSLSFADPNLTVEIVGGTFMDTFAVPGGLTEEETSALIGDPLGGQTIDVKISINLNGSDKEIRDLMLVASVPDGSTAPPVSVSVDGGPLGSISDNNPLGNEGGLNNNNIASYLVFNLPDTFTSDGMTTVSVAVSGVPWIHFDAKATLEKNNGQISTVVSPNSHDATFATPEPGTIIGLGTFLGIGMLYGWRRRKQAA